MSIQSYIDGAWSNRATYSPGETRLLLQPVVGYVGIGTADGNYLYKLFVNGSTANTTGVWANLSDARAKKDIAPISNALDIILKLNPVSFNWIDQKKNQELGRVRGFIAQDVEKVIPEWIIVDKTNGYKNLQPIGMDAMLVGSIKELNTKIISQQTEITSLQSIVADITKEISTQLIKTKKLIVDGVDILKKLNELSDIVSKQQKEIEEMKQTIKLLKGEKK